MSLIFINVVQDWVDGVIPRRGWFIQEWFSHLYICCNGPALGLRLLNDYEIVEQIVPVHQLTGGLNGLTGTKVSLAYDESCRNRAEKIELFTFRSTEEVILSVKIPIPHQHHQLKFKIRKHFELFEAFFASLLLFDCKTFLFLARSARGMEAGEWKRGIGGRGGNSPTRATLFLWLSVHTHTRYTPDVTVWRAV